MVENTTRYMESSSFRCQRTLEIDQPLIFWNGIGIIVTGDSVIPSWLPTKECLSELLAGKGTHHDAGGRFKAAGIFIGPEFATVKKGELGDDSHLYRTHLMTDPHADDTSRLRSLGWPAADVSRFLNLQEYKRRWGAANLEREERLFLKQAELALLQAGLNPIRREARSSSSPRLSASSTSYLPGFFNAGK